MLDVDNINVSHSRSLYISDNDTIVPRSYHNQENDIQWSEYFSDFNGSWRNIDIARSSLAKESSCNLNILRIYLSLRCMLLTICYIHYIIRSGSNSHVYSLHLNSALRCSVVCHVQVPPSWPQFIFSWNILIGSPSRHETHNTSIIFLTPHKTGSEFHSLKEVLEMMEYPSTAMWHFLHSDTAWGWICWDVRQMISSGTTDNCFCPPAISFSDKNRIIMAIMISLKWG